MQRLSHGSLHPSRATALSAAIVNTTKTRHILSLPYLTPLMLNLCESPMYLLSWLVNQQTCIQHLLKEGCYSRTPASFCGSEDIFSAVGQFSSFLISEAPNHYLLQTYHMLFFLSICVFWSYFHPKGHTS